MASKVSYNEQLKLVSGSLQSLGIALIIAIAGVWWNEGFSLKLVFWMLAATFMLSTAYVLLGNLEEHEE